MVWVLFLLKLSRKWQKRIQEFQVGLIVLIYDAAGADAYVSSELERPLPDLLRSTPRRDNERYYYVLISLAHWSECDTFSYFMPELDVL